MKPKMIQPTLKPIQNTSPQIISPASKQPQQPTIQMKPLTDENKVKDNSDQQSKAISQHAQLEQVLAEKSGTCTKKN